jgi:hypothetical protein
LKRTNEIRLFTWNEWYDAEHIEATKVKKIMPIRNKDTIAGWLEKVFRAGQDPQRVVVPIITLVKAR